MMVAWSKTQRVTCWLCDSTCSYSHKHVALLQVVQWFNSPIPGQQLASKEKFHKILSPQIWKRFLQYQHCHKNTFFLVLRLKFRTCIHFLTYRKSKGSRRSACFQLNTTLIRTGGWRRGTLFVTLEEEILQDHGPSRAS